MDVITTAAQQVHYPETDGKPMAETDVHIDALISLREALKDYFREAPQVYVAGNMLLYYEEGNPAACVAPDVFVVQGVVKCERRIYRLWEEGQAPAVVFEITSCGTRLEDLGTKRAVYAMLGVQEYFLYDPLGEYLQPPWQGYRLQEGEYQRLLPGGQGELTSQMMGMALRLEAADRGRRWPLLPHLYRLVRAGQSWSGRRREVAGRVVEDELRHLPLRHQPTADPHHIPPDRTTQLERFRWVNRER